jgi:biotin carboxyl carrier protein
MKYFATVNDQAYEIDIDHHGRVSVNGEELAADMRLVGAPQIYSLLIEQASHEVVLDTETEQRNQYSVMVGGMRFAVKVQDERSRRLALVDRSLRASDGELLIRAPIPGLVVKVAVSAGQEVVEGDALIILEAMKMENELRAPRAGVIHEVKIAAGAQVAQGQTLLTLK